MQSFYMNVEKINKMIDNFIKWVYITHYFFTFGRLVIWTSFKYQSNSCSLLLVYIAMLSRTKWNDTMRAFSMHFLIRTAHVIDFSFVEKKNVFITLSYNVQDKELARSHTTTQAQFISWRVCLTTQSESFRYQSSFSIFYRTYLTQCVLVFCAEKQRNRVFIDSTNLIKK